jgi:hypothetical protein
MTDCGVFRQAQSVNGNRLGQLRAQRNDRRREEIIHTYTGGSIKRKSVYIGIDLAGPQSKGAGNMVVGGKRLGN